MSTPDMISRKLDFTLRGKSEADLKPASPTFEPQRIKINKPQITKIYFIDGI